MWERKSDSPSGIRCSSQLVRIKSEQTEIQRCRNPDSGRIFAGSSPGQQDECGEKSANFLPPSPTPPLFGRSPSPRPLPPSLSLTPSLSEKPRSRGKMVVKVDSNSCVTTLPVTRVYYSVLLLHTMMDLTVWTIGLLRDAHMDAGAAHMSTRT